VRQTLACQTLAAALSVPSDSMIMFFSEHDEAMAVTLTTGPTTRCRYHTQSTRIHTERARRELDIAGRPIPSDRFFASQCEVCPRTSQSRLQTLSSFRHQSTSCLELEQ